MFHIALFEPQIAPNTGNAIRLCSNNGCHLHLIEPLGFSMEEKQLRRASLDYRDLANVTIHKNYDAFLQEMGPRRIFALTTKGSIPHNEPTYQEGDVLLFGSETSGLPDDIRDAFAPDRRIRIPMLANARSLNLSNSIAIVSYEAWRQLDFSMPVTKL
ncbi:tRNA (cytidine(34)-2'-O)-methyltransferase [Brumicola nitratireducens]|uniref:tRNA (cytidine(34)-2'-O)-methyltransferase n=1 Tax=Glaciecola nitratireducens (strain JCM 12485 / KCTC 12276 / FR1064) TaxID=1085623 RepID=G4QJI8_GLANF|nr:tRNA (cytidine(34)-2'-O)-methyltransferase [Glaciecola nitratireducens]AEP28648.1 putative rRNA methylase [Glaciecola nitratireducens FR1064]